MTTQATQEDNVANLMLRVYHIHETILEETDGLPGVRDFPALHAAVARPFVTFAGEELYPSTLEKAAALFHSCFAVAPGLGRASGRSGSLAAIRRLGARRRECERARCA